MNYEQKIDVFYSLFFIYISFLNVYLYILQHSIQNQVHIGTSRSCYNKQNDHTLHYGNPSSLKCKIIALWLWAMVGQTMQWGNIRFTVGWIVVIHLEILHAFFVTGVNTLGMQSLYTSSSCPLFYSVRQTISIITNVNKVEFVCPCVCTIYGVYQPKSSKWRPVIQHFILLSYSCNTVYFTYAKLLLW